MNKVLVVGGLALTGYLVATKGKEIFNKIKAAENLSFDVLQLKYQGIYQSKVNLYMVTEITNHSQTDLNVEDIILDVRMPNGIPSAKINEKINSVIKPRERNKIAFNLKIDILKTGASVADLLVRYLNNSPEERSLDKLLAQPVTIKGSLKAEGFTIPIDEKIGVQNDEQA